MAEEFEDNHLGTGVPARNRVIRTVEKNAANGVAGLDGSGKLDASVLPASLDTNFAENDLTVNANRSHNVGDKILAFDLSDAPNTGEVNWNANSGYLFRQNSLTVQIGGLGSGTIAVFTGASSGGVKYGGDYSANYTDRSLVDKGYVVKSKTIFNLVASPSPLTANTNNLSISGLANSNVIYLSTNGSNYDLTGIVSTGLVNGQTYFLYNTGATGDIKLKNNDANSTAANRFITNGDVVIKNGMGVILTYDTAVSRWRVNYFK